MSSRGWVIKIFSFGRNRIKSILEDLRIRKRKKNTMILREKKASDLGRWKNKRELDSSWNQRTYILASYIEPGSRVIEFGAGNLSLKSRLPENCTYQASDIVNRDPDCLICDLNEEIKIDLRSYDTAVFSGVLEYVYNVDRVIAQLSGNIKNIILSYACNDLSNAPRLESGWLSDYSRVELEKIFAAYDYKITDYTTWRNQSLYRLEKTNQNDL